YTSARRTRTCVSSPIPSIVPNPCAVPFSSRRRCARSADVKSLGSKAKGARLERMRASPRWAGEGFRNLHPVLPGLRDPNTPMPTVKDFFCEEGRRVPKSALPSANPLEAWKRPPQGGLRATWLGHSTVLIEIDGVRVLTDPVWGPRASPFAL